MNCEGLNFRPPHKFSRHFLRLLWTLTSSLNPNKRHESSRKKYYFILVCFCILKVFLTKILKNLFFICFNLFIF